MNPIDHMATTLTGRSPWPFDLTQISTDRPESKTERMRAYLRQHGAANAATLADEADLATTGLVAALLKGDIARGSVFRKGHKYHWNPQFDSDHSNRLADAARLLRANGFSVSTGTDMRTTPSCDCLNHCFDDERVRAGRATPCEYGARQLAENRQTEVLVWVNPTPATMPDADSTVLCELEGDSESVWPGYWDGDYWCSVDGSVFQGKVTGWAEWPTGRKGGVRHG